MITYEEASLTMNENPIDISVVIPVHNSSDCLVELLRQLTDILNKGGRRYEVVMVDDGSTDSSWEVIRTLCGQYALITAIRLMRNFGQVHATMRGLRQARGEIIVTMDDDLQHRPDQLPLLLDALTVNPGVDCVFGWFPEKKHAWYRNLGSRVIQRIMAGVFRLPEGVHVSSYRAMRRRLVDALLAYRTTNPVISTLVFSSTRNIVSIPIEHGARHAGRSSYSLGKQLHLALDAICNVSMLPLRALSVMGATICFLCFIFILSVLYRYFQHRIMVPGWTTLSISVAFFCGLTLVGLGIVGEYLVRILREVRGGQPCIDGETIASRASEDAAGPDHARNA